MKQLTELDLGEQDIGVISFYQTPVIYSRIWWKW